MFEINEFKVFGFVFVIFYYYSIVYWFVSFKYFFQFVVSSVVSKVFYIYIVEF